MRNSSKIWWLGGLPILALVIAIALPLVSHANEKGWKPSPEKVLCRLDARLDLTAEQKEKLTPIVSKEMEKRREMFVEHRREMDRLRAEFHEKMDKERANTEKEMASLLTADQMQEFKKMTDERRERWQERHKERPCRGGFHGPRGCW